MKPHLLVVPGFCFYQMGELKKAAFCTLLQLSIAGWIPAVIWAFSASNCEAAKKQKINKILQDVKNWKVA